MPKYKLTYFNAKGFAETSRMLFVQAGVEYEDVRIEREKWPEVKKTMPFGQMPVLEVDGVQIADSSAIARYLAREFGMAGKSHVEEAHVDMFAGASHDLMKPMIEIFHAEDETKKAELKKKYTEETVPKFLNKFESTLASSASGYLVGDGLTWADIIFMIFMTWVVKGVPAEALDKYPKVKEHGERVAGLPKIAEWIKNRPVTET